MSGNVSAFCSTSENQYYVPALAERNVERYQARPSSAVALRSRSVDVILAGHVRPDLVLIKPVGLNVELDTNGWYVAASDVFPIHGVGLGAHEAVEDYLDYLIDYCEVVAASAAGGNVYDQDELAYLQNFVSAPERRHAA